MTRAVYDAHPPDPARARGDVPRHGLSLLASSQKKLGLADRLRARSAARKTNHSHSLRTGRAMGASAARSTRRAEYLRFRSARNAGRRPRRPEGRFDRMMTLFLRWRTSRTTAPVCWPRLGGVNRGSTDLNWALIGVERVCRTFVTERIY